MFELTFPSSTIESNLDSVSVTPRIHREDLLRYAHRPVCQLLKFDALNHQDGQVVGSSLTGLRALYDNLINRSSNKTDFGTDSEFQATLTTVRAFCKKAEAMCDRLGSWAAEHFVHQTIRALEKSNDGLQNLFDAQGTSRRALLHQSRLHTLGQAHIDPTDDNISSKVKCLMSFLLEEDVDEPVGIVFVEQRATTSVLAALLRRRPATRDRFRCAPFVGVSSSPSRRYGLTELVDLKAQARSTQQNELPVCVLNRLCFFYNSQSPISSSSKARVL